MTVTLYLVALLFLSPLSFGILFISLPVANSFYNRIAGGSLLHAAILTTSANPTMVLAFVATLVYHFVPIFVALAFASVAAGVIAMVCGIFIMAGVFRAAYQVPLMRGFLLAGCHFLIATFIATILLAAAQYTMARAHWVIIPAVGQKM